MDPKIRVLVDRLIVDGKHYIQAFFPPVPCRSL